MPQQFDTGRSLEERFLENVSREGFWNPDRPLLLAVSGGVDSVVLATLMQKTGLECAIAHCNFHLRDKESDIDETFTQQLADSLGMDCYVEHFNTYEYAFREGISTEMAARDLRYAWFHKLLKMHQFQCVVTGHHADDQIETMLLNLSRGTGISGLRGMLPRSGQIVRPLLKFYRHEIEAYALACGLAWREDLTNRSTEIRRNRIRHEILPVFDALNPNCRQSMISTMNFLRDAEIIYRETVDRKLHEITTPYRNGVKVSVEKLKELTPRGAWLFELLSPYGFNTANIQAIGEALDAISGKQFVSPTHRLVKDRDALIILPGTLTDEETWEYFINETDTAFSEPFPLKCSMLPARGYVFSNDSGVAALDAGKLRFPLTLRKWRKGDVFVPLGMRNRKKLSDFFTNLKMSIPEKEQIWVVTSEQEIVWVAGLRIDNRYRITEHTQQIFVLQMEVEAQGSAIRQSKK